MRREWRKSMLRGRVELEALQAVGNGKTLYINGMRMS